MNYRRRRRRRGSTSFGPLVEDSAHIAARFGPTGAMVTGAVGFTLLYAIIPMLLSTWAEANKAKLIGPAATVFAKLLDDVMWHRFIHPSQWAGIAVLLVCWGIAAWKVRTLNEMSQQEIAGASWLAKVVARLFS